MHLYIIKTREGKKYADVLVTDKFGRVANPLCTILRDDPHIYVSTNQGVCKVPFSSIEQVVCQGERIGIRKDETGKPYPLISDVDELPVWREFYEVYKAHEEELKELPQDEKILRVLNLRELCRK